jgi:signal peptidase I
MARKKKRGRPAAEPAAGTSQDREDLEEKAESDGSKPDGAVRKDRTTFDSVRENLEAFLIAVILAIVIRHFAVEAFEIPTGSMANTLFGMHAWLECPNCSTEYNVALQSDSSTGKISVRYQKFLIYDGDCPNPSCTLRLHSRGPSGRPLNSSVDLVKCGSCGQEFRGDPRNFRESSVHDDHNARCPICHHEVRHVVIEEKNRYGGHKILVTKFAYVIGKPQRWDVIVFEFDQWKNYIKRLIGLPGERIDVWDGDLYVDGKIERKPPRVQQALWTKISDSDVAERGLNPVAAWAEATPRERSSAPVSKSTQWNSTLKRWSVNALGDAAILRYQRRFDNYYSYNLLSEHLTGTRGCPENVQVGDKKVSFTAKIAGKGQSLPGASPARPSWIGAEIREGDFTFQLRIPIGSASETSPATLVRLATDTGSFPSPVRAPHESGLQASKALAVPIGAAARIELEDLDDKIAARLDGEEILAIEYTSLPPGASPQNCPDPPSESRDPGAHYVYIIASNLQVEIESIQVYRDMYYISRAGQSMWWGPGIQLAEGQYFAMGDNAPSSSDGRYWGYIPEQNLMGKALLVFWPAWPANFQWKFIR